MIQRLIPLVLFSTLLLTDLVAQIPESILLRPSTGNTVTSRMMCNDDAGTISLSLNEQTIPNTRDSIFLNFGDSLVVTSSNSSILDPDTSTPSGVGFTIYDCEPSVSGPTLSDITGDCIEDKANFVVLDENGDPTISRLLGDDGVWVFPIRRADNSLSFFNQEGMQVGFNQGNPVDYWFAPLTLHNLSPANNTSFYEDDPNGDCVNVNIDERFHIVFLNEIKIDSINQTGRAVGCDGDFRIFGGYPDYQELQGNEVDYTNITIELASDPTIKGEVLGTGFTSGQQVFFTVPQAGVYNIIVEDEKGGMGMGTVTMAGCETVSAELPRQSTLQNEQVCLPLTVAGFQDIVSIQFSINWDPTVLQFDTLPENDFNIFIPDFDKNDFNLDDAANGEISVSWFDAQNTQPVTIPDNAAEPPVLFTVCFTAIGPLGSDTDVEITGTPTAIDIYNVQGQRKGLLTTDGYVQISNTTMLIDVQTSDVACRGGDDGSFNIIINNGAAPYRVAVNSLPSNTPLTDLFPIGDNEPNVNYFPILAAGDYELVITDDNGQEERDTITINEPNTSFSLEGFADPAFDPQCFGDSTGQAEVRIFDDTNQRITDYTDYTFEWSEFGDTDIIETTRIINNYPGGRYTVTVTDPNQCQQEESVTINSPSVILLSVDDIQAPRCDGVDDGIIEVSATGGTPDMSTGTARYIFNWSPIPFTDQPIPRARLTDLAADTYFVTITDDQGCTTSTSVDLNDTQKKINLVNATTDVQDVTCFQGTDGTITLEATATGDVDAFPYTYSIIAAPDPSLNQDNVGATATFENLQPGPYIIRIEDTEGCYLNGGDTSFVIGQPTELLVDLVEKRDETCLNNGMDGTASVFVQGGSLPYTYNWSNGQTFIDSTITGLSADDYEVTVVDRNGCEAELATPITINSPTPPSISAISTMMLNCPESQDGELNVTAEAGGAPIQSYTWLDTLGNVLGNSATITGLQQGTYIVEVMGEDACTILDTTFITAPDSIQFQFTNDEITLPTCPGDADGKITPSVIGGTTPYDFRWDNGATTDSLTNITAGAYSVTVTDANGCSDVQELFIVINPPDIVLDFPQTDITGVSCNGAFPCDGVATVNASYSNGTTGIFDFQWEESGETTANAESSMASALCQGPQKVIVSDGKCIVEQSVEIPAPDALSLTILDKTDVSCFGRSDATATVQAEGGTGANYQYDWETGTMNATVSDLAAGEYNVTVTDANGCEFSTNVQINEPAELVIEEDLTQVGNVACNGETNGNITLQWSGGNFLDATPFTWSDANISSADSIATDLAAGDYSVTITDAKGCTDNATFTIVEPSPIIADIPPIDAPLCYGYQTALTVSGASGGNGELYTFSVNGAPEQLLETPFPIFAGTHTVTVYDGAGCPLDIDINIDQPDPIEIQIPETIEVELGDSIRLDPRVFPLGTVLDSVRWSPGDFLSSTNELRPYIRPIESEEYTLTVTDANGCLGTTNVFVDVDKNRNIYIPNAFYPGSSTGNDKFKVYAGTGVREIGFIQVFNRWGELVYQQNGPLSPDTNGVGEWDGRFNGRYLPAGAYIYIVEVKFDDDIELLYRGDVVIVDSKVR